MDSKQQKLISDMKKWPKGLQQVMVTADKCVKHLVSKGQPHDKAESTVLEIIKESASDIQAQRYNTVITLLEITFLNKDVSEINIGKILKDYSHE